MENSFHKILQTRLSSLVSPMLLYSDVEIDYKERPSLHVKATVLLVRLYRRQRDLTFSLRFDQ